MNMYVVSSRVCLTTLSNTNSDDDESDNGDNDNEVSAFTTVFS